MLELVIRLPFKEIPSYAITELDIGTKRPLRPLKYGNRDNFVPFVDLTGLRCMKWDEDKYLSVLDFDYSDKWSNPILNEFEYKNTYIRESKNGLHLFYMSDKPCDIVQSKNNINVDLRRVTTVNPDSWGNHVVLYDLPTNQLPVMEIDFNKVVESLYKQCNEPVRHYGDYTYSTSRTGNYKLQYQGITLYHRIIAQYIQDLNEDWSHAYDLSYKLGLHFATVLDSDKDAESVATALMETVEYPYKYNWIINFVNGYNDSEYRKSYIGEIKIHYSEIYRIRRELALEYVNKSDEYILEDLKQYNPLKLYQFAQIVEFLK